MRIDTADGNAFILLVRPVVLKLPGKKMYYKESVITLYSHIEYLYCQIRVSQTVENSFFHSTVPLDSAMHSRIPPTRPTPV